MIKEKINNMRAPNGHLSEEQRDWFIELFTKLKPKYCLEIGFAGGRHTATLLNSCNPKKVISIDIDFDYSSGREYIDIIKSKFGNIEFIEQNSSQCLNQSFFQEKFPNGIDYVLVDGGHTYSECESDMNICWEYLNKNGKMIVDDYNSGPPIGISIPEVTNAIEDFAKKYQLQFETIKLNDGKGMAVFTK